jgi:peptidylprolyl isomerase
MAQAKTGDAVKIHYTGRLDDGTEFDSSSGRGPLDMTIGDGRVIPGFEEAVIGMAPGEKKTVTLPPEQAYGPRAEELVHEVERSAVPGQVDLKAGMRMRGVGENGETLTFTVTDFTDEMVTLDANHPLAGKELTFEIELVEIDETAAS